MQIPQRNQMHSSMTRLLLCQSSRRDYTETKRSPRPLAQYLCVSVLRFAGKLLGSDGENTNGASKTAAVYDRRDAAASPASL
ncbi:hypothetical protein F2P81_019133 [Scophthalmus maximus]|uniref:Uncharacterized protein n=1 Tax=Scophthalmus maximus TaxID=52904 RepID=A0A6A4RYU4_SCOMX|nr:hypothetical protein F2P81_019133 [Scophthalmus maximus]